MSQLIPPPCYLLLASECGVRCFGERYDCVEEGLALAQEQAGIYQARSGRNRSLGGWARWSFVGSSAHAGLVGFLNAVSTPKARKPMIVVAKKIEVCQDPTHIEAVKVKVREHALPFYAISAVTETGLDELRYAIATKIFSIVEDVAIAV